jgi:cysteine desulfurase
MPERLIEGGGHERGRRAGTENIPGIASMAAAFEENCLKIKEHAEYISGLRDKLIAGLSKIPNSVVNGDLTHRLPGNVNMCFEGIEGESLLLMLDMRGIAASSGSACTSGSLDPSHVLLALGRPHEVAHGSLRLSLSHYNTEEEIEYIIETVSEVAARLRDMSPVWEKIQKGIEKSKL